MSVTEVAQRTSTGGVERVLTGWGRTAPSRCSVVAVGGVDEVPELLAREAARGGGVIARGAGRSYGDAAQLTAGTVLDMSGCDQIVWVDAEGPSVRAQGGATIAQLLVRLAGDGLTLPVVPGTRHVTVAGAIASDIHGKNHHLDGALARHVRSISLCTPASGVVEVSPEQDAELFYATLGGNGLTGVVLEATLAAEPLRSQWVAVDTDRTDSLEHTLELLGGEERHRYSVAWLDMLAHGRRMGRAVLERADPMSRQDAHRHLSRRRRNASYPAALSRPPLLQVPRSWPARPPAASVRAFNALRWAAAPRREREHPRSMHSYFFPLDVLGGWNRLYGAGGLVQYQLVVPDGAEDALQASFELLRARRLPVYLAVLKRFGAEFGGPLSFPLEGVTLAMDLPARADGVRAALDELDDLVAGCGGRVYLTKDSRLRAGLLEAMYPRVAEFQRLRERVDPGGAMRSDLARRVGLCGQAP